MKILLFIAALIIGNFRLELGTKSVDSLRAKLDEAMKSKDRNVLDKVISECVSAGMPELTADIQKARSVADILRGGTGG